MVEAVGISPPRAYTSDMSWVIGAYLGINAILFSLYLDTERAVGSTALIVFNSACVLSLLAFYFIVRINSER